MTWQPLLPAYRVEGGRLVRAANLLPQRGFMSVAKLMALVQSLMRYRRARARYEAKSEHEQPSYTDFEITKLDIADKLLELLGERTTPKSPKWMSSHVI